MKRGKERELCNVSQLYLLPISGFKICVLSSAQMERHSVNNWCPVALIGATAGYTWNCCKTNSTEWETRRETNSKYPNFQYWLLSSKACSSNFRLLSLLTNSPGPGCWPDNDTNRRVMTARLRLLSCLTSASIDPSPSPRKHGTASVGPVQHRKLISTYTDFASRNKMMPQTWWSLHGSTGSVARNILIWRSESSYKLPSRNARNITICLLKVNADSSEELDTNLQQSHDAIFMYKRALQTTLCKIWMATTLFLQMESWWKWKTNTNTMAYQV